MAGVVVVSYGMERFSQSPPTHVYITCYSSQAVGGTVVEMDVPLSSSSLQLVKFVSWRRKILGYNEL